MFLSLNSTAQTWPETTEYFLNAVLEDHVIIGGQIWYGRF